MLPIATLNLLLLADGAQPIIPLLAPATEKTKKLAELVKPTTISQSSNFVAPSQHNLP